MNLLLVLTILGWICTLIPLTAFFVISITMIKGAGEDDHQIQALTIAGLTIFTMGVVLLLAVYLKDFFLGI